MKVAVVASGLAYEAGAIPVRARLEAESLINHGHKVVGFGRSTSNFPRIQITFPYVETVPLILPRPFASISMWFTYEWRLARALLKEDRLSPFDMVIEHEQAYGIARRITYTKMKAKWVCLVQRTIYDTISSGRCPFNPVHAKLLQWGANYEFGHADAIITLHEEMSTEIKAHCSRASSMKAIPNGISITEISFDENSNIRRDDVILYAGRLSPEKCVDVLIRAFRRLNHSGCELRIAGDTPKERDKLEAMVKRLGITSKVIFLGALKHRDVLKEMRKATVFVLPSVSEGLPFVVLEAMASGLPIIASNIAGTRAIIGPDEGILTPPKDEDALVRAMGRLLDDSRLRSLLSRNAFQRVQGYSWRKITESATEFYETIGSV